MKRKGLNMRFLWLVLLKLRHKLQREFVMNCIFLKAMKKIINEEIKLKSKVHMS